MSGRAGTSRKAGAQQPTSKAIATKKLIVQEYKDRLKSSVKSLNDNFECILAASRINCDDQMHRANSVGKLGEFYAVRDEALARAALLVKASDELQMLTNDIREFLTLRDFNFISDSIAKAEEANKRQLDQHEKQYNSFRANLSSMSAEIDRELAGHFLFRY